MDGLPSRAPKAISRGCSPASLTSHDRERSGISSRESAKASLDSMKGAMPIVGGVLTVFSLGHEWYTWNDDQKKHLGQGTNSGGESLVGVIVNRLEYRIGDIMGGANVVEHAPIGKQANHHRPLGWQASSECESPRLSALEGKGRESTASTAFHVKRAALHARPVWGFPSRMDYNQRPWPS